MSWAEVWLQQEMERNGAGVDENRRRLRGTRSTEEADWEDVTDLAEQEWGLMGGLLDDTEG